MRHHTKDKGDVGLGFVIADLISTGIQVALPMSEHLPFDCIAISKSGALKRLSVKYRAATEGSLVVGRRSSWADRKGSHERAHNRGEYDAFAIFCPETKKCYYVLEDEVTGKHFTLRITPGRQKNGVHNAADFENPNRLFALVAQRTEPRISNP